LKHASWMVLFTLTAGTAMAKEAWRGDFESANLTQWTKAQITAADRAVVTRDPIRQGKYAVRITVRQGDNPINASGNRSELVRMTNEAPGSEYYYRFSTMFPSNFPNVNRWQVFLQWHHTGNNGSPPVECYVLLNQMRCRVGGANGKVLWTRPLERNKWQNFIFHLKWSSNASVGFIEMWRNGKKELPKKYVATQYPGERTILKVGYYRDNRVTQTAQIYHDSVVQATRLHDLVPPTFGTGLYTEDDSVGGEVSPPSPTDIHVDENATWDELPTDPDGPPGDDAVDFTEEELASIPVPTEADAAAVEAESQAADEAAGGVVEPIAEEMAGGCSSLPGSLSGSATAVPALGGLLYGLSRRRRRRSAGAH